jgi:hypothetical protein
VRRTLLELVEEPERHLPAVPRGETIELDGLRFVAGPRRASVESIRLGGDSVQPAVAETRRLAREREIGEVIWWVGELSTPPGLADELLALGLEPEPETPELASLTLTSRPGGSPTAEVRRVETFEQYLQELAIDWEVWKPSPSDLEERRAAAAAAWELVLADGRSSHFLGFVDGEPAGFGRLVVTPQAGLLLGGAVLPQARGRGVYTSLVHARWDESVARGVPRLAVGAGHMSAPILERLGFERIGGIRLLRDRL